MTIKFHAPHPWGEIKKNAIDKKCFVAVPFLGRNAATYLPIGKGSVLITRCNEQSIKAGQVDPSEVLKFIRRGVIVHNYSTLHAKVYVLGRKLFVGSANVSKSSQGLSEACIETNDPKMIAQAKKYIESLSSDLVTEEQVRRFIKLYPGENNWSFGTVTKSNKVTDTKSRGAVWITSVYNGKWDDESELLDRDFFKVVKTKIADPTVSKLNRIEYDEKPPFRKNQTLIIRWSKGRGFAFECPAKIVEIIKVLDTGKYIVYLDQPKNAKNISSTEVNKLFNGKIRNFCFSSQHQFKEIKSEKIAKEFVQMWSHFRV